MKFLELSSGSREHFSGLYIKEFISAVNQVVVF